MNGDHRMGWFFGSSQKKLHGYGADYSNEKEVIEGVFLLGEFLNVETQKDLVEELQ